MGHHLLETARCHPNAAVVVPAVTETRNPVNLRTAPGADVEVLPPFSAPPAAIVYVMPADVVRRLGGWGEEYEVASGEDVDLCFKAWVNDLDVVYDQRVLVQHVGKGSARNLDDWQGLWARNRRRFLEKWMGDGEVPRLDSCEPARFARNRETVACRRGIGWTATSRCAIAKIAGCGGSSPSTARYGRICSVGRTPDGAVCGPAFLPGREPSGLRGSTSRVTALARVRSGRGVGGLRRADDCRRGAQPPEHRRGAARAERHRPHGGEDRARRGDHGNGYVPVRPPVHRGDVDARARRAHDELLAGREVEHVLARDADAHVAAGNPPGD